MRTVLVWMDPNYHKYFFRFRTDLLKTKAGDLRARFKLKKKLKCKSFKWYLENVYKNEKFIFDQNVIGYGTIGNPATNLCLDILNRDEEKSNPLGVYTCSFTDLNSTTNQVLSFTKSGEIRREETCATLSDSFYVDMAKCINVKLSAPEKVKIMKRKKSKQLWSYDENSKTIKNRYNNQCLSTRNLSSGDDIIIETCNTNDLHQKWTLQNYTPN